ncbi:MULTISPECIES: LysR family transcriptional regulator [unclassified Variovorax]|uniref:LysR family transcriptional regulator n=1 Tax=unclassified Variovorax TaxID=663243 RepID=UPI0025771A2B|nr:MULTISPECIES: LysR family transcriptional regulator [unclassified Variovorax]MDM0085818.1 LysR family transcriptional regulator [Variovorax sp. J22G40]MDM0145924.1 LysR family transcriptional regulator [Variovorax sp. J2P1-31]
MNLRQLQYFCEMAEGGSAVQAAQRLFVAPTAISMSVSQLEADLGGQLFDRSTRPMRLTPLGKFLLPRAQELLAQTRRLEGDARRVASARQGWLGVGFTRSVMLSVLPVAVRRFREAFPDVRLEMVELLAEHQPAQMESGKVHLGIARFIEPVPPPPGFSTCTLFEEPLLAALPLGIRADASTPLTLAELARYPFISYPRDPKTRYAAQVLAAAEQRGSPLTVQHEAMEIHTALGLVAAGLGVTLVGASVALNARQDVALHAVEGLDATTTVVTVMPDVGRNAFVDPFVALLQEATVQLGLAPSPALAPAAVPAARPPAKRRRP